METYFSCYEPLHNAHRFTASLGERENISKGSSKNVISKISVSQSCPSRPYLLPKPTKLETVITTKHLEASIIIIKYP